MFYKLIIDLEKKYNKLNILNSLKTKNVFKNVYLMFYSILYIFITLLTSKIAHLVKKTNYDFLSSHIKVFF